MPKSLSVKKVPSKTQKPITQFFKNPTSLLTKNVACNSEQFNSKKRKATTSDNAEGSTPCDNLKNENSVATIDFKSTTNKNKIGLVSIPNNLLIDNEALLQNSMRGTVSDSNENNVLSCIKDRKNLCETENVLNNVEKTVYLIDNSKEKSPLCIIDNVENILMSDVDIENDMFDLTPTAFCSNSLKSDDSPNGKQSFNNTDIKESEPLKEIYNPEVNTLTNVDKTSPSFKRSPTVTELRRSPRIAAQKLTPHKQIDNDSSNCPKRAKIALNFDSDDFSEILDDTWIKVQADEENLDLCKMQRCEIIDIERYPTRMKLKLKNSVNQKCTCYIEGIWKDVPLSIGDIVSIIATKSSENVYCVNNSTGLLVLRPDFLISSTSVVSGVFCRRKAVLQERFKGLDSSNTAMTIGILVHELVQKALTQKIQSVNKLHIEAQSLVKESISMLYDAELSMDEVYTSMNMYIPSLSSFVKQYILDRSSSDIRNHSKNTWNGYIDDVLDIEENICCSKLGLKGKIDATLQVTIHNRTGKQKRIIPLELKSGKASGSVEHRGQLILYSMMLALQRNANPDHDPDQSGLLLYLKDKIDMREVKSGYPERRDLIMLRNQLVQYLAPGPKSTNCDNVVDIEEAAHLLRQQLPEPVHHQTACGKCPYLTLCSLHLWHTEGPQVSESHPLNKLRETALGHLLNSHISYFLHWAALCKLEEQSQATRAPLHALWTENPEKRAQRGICIPNLQIESVMANGDRFVHVFKHDGTLISDNNKDNSKGPQEGEFAIVSTNDRPWIASGTIVLIDSKVHILLERDLSRRHPNTCLFHIDTYESYATTVQNLTNLGVLMDDDDNSDRLRRLIIDMEIPEFEKKMPREIGRLGSKLMKGLNIEQQRAVLRAIAARDYALLQGLPGTGKTQTISVLIQMLVALKQRVLVTAHTHSAVDNVLSRLPTTLKILRLGTSSRVAPAIQPFCEHRLAESCTTPEELAKLYECMDVVGVTCLGASHALLTKTKFDICIVDEATQVLQCTVLRPLFAARRFVLVGDPAQLPPVVKSNTARRLGMEVSLFARLSAVKAEAQSTLCLQYRMNTAITELANAVVYGGRLRCANDDVRNATVTLSYEKMTHVISSLWLSTACSSKLEQSVIFLDTGSIISHSVDTKSNSNKDEALIVLAVLKALFIGGMALTHIGVIAPFREQVALLRKSVLRLFKNDTPPEVSTVDQFQGRDKSVIIFSCTKNSTVGNQEGKSKEGEILNDPRRLAVSVTRAKHKFIMIGNVSVLEKYEPFQKLITACSPVILPVDWPEGLHKEFECLL